MRALSINLLTSVIMQLLGIVSGILVARLLGPAGRGDLAAIFLWPSIITAIGMISLNESIIYEAASRTTSLGRILSSSFVLAGVIAPVLVVFGLLLFPFIYGAKGSEVLGVANLYLAFIPLAFFTLFPASMLQGRMRIFQWNAMRAVVPVGYVIGLLGLMWIDLATLQNIVLTMLCAVALNLMLALVFFKRLAWAPERPRLNDMKHLLRYGAKAHLGSMSRFATQWLDQAAISVVLLAADLGLYVVAVTVARGVIVISTTIEAVAFPRLAAEVEREKKSEILGRFMKFTIGLVALGSIALFLLTTAILEWLFGSAFLPAAPVVYVLLVANIFVSVNLLLGATFKGYGQPMLASKLQAKGVVVLVVAMAIQLPAFGMIGAAFSVLLAQATTCLLLALSARRYLGLSLRHIFVPTMEDAVWVAKKIRPNL